ncbi:MAG: hypothetical protein AAFQ37_14935, partial [Bacteroidota bacterium]
RLFSEDFKVAKFYLSSHRSIMQLPLRNQQTYSPHSNDRQSYSKFIDGGRGMCAHSIAISSTLNFSEGQ